MKQRYQQLYDALLAEMQEAQSIKMEEAEYIAACFWIATGYWDKLKEIALPFTDDLDEIMFFKKVKPAFTSWIEYYTIVSEALVSVNAVTFNVLLFWIEEEKRYDNYYQRNKEFIDYIEGGSINRDAYFFLRRTANPAIVPRTPVYDEATELTSSFDHKVRACLAKKMYRDYCRAKINGLPKTSE